MTNTPSDKPDLFKAFVENLDTDGIDGLACEIVHPIAVEVMEEAAAQDVVTSLLTPVERQVTDCVIEETLARMEEHGLMRPIERPDGESFLLIQPEAMDGVMHMMSIHLRLADRAVAERLGAENGGIPDATAEIFRAFGAFMEAYLQDDRPAITMRAHALIDIARRYSATLRTMGLDLTVDYPTLRHLFDDQSRAA